MNAMFVCLTSQAPVLQLTLYTFFSLPEVTTTWLSYSHCYLVMPTVQGQFKFYSLLCPQCLAELCMYAANIS